MRRCVHLPLSDASHFSCHLWRLSCLMFFLFFSCSSGVLLRCSYSCFLSTASTSMGIIPAITHTATSDTVRKTQDTLRALSRLTAAIFRRHSLILRASPQMAIPYVTMEATTEARSFLRGCRGSPIFDMSLVNAVATLADLTAACSTWCLKLSLVSSITPRYLIQGWEVMVHYPTSKVMFFTCFLVVWGRLTPSTDVHCLLLRLIALVSLNRANLNVSSNSGKVGFPLARCAPFTSWSCGTLHGTILSLHQWTGVCVFLFPFLGMAASQAFTTFCMTSSIQWSRKF